ncbi:MAG: acylphosphatase [Gemmatimonadetes bacterium]|nr:acylphosphatase [Gemmatimonadota bacterium]NNL30676.1 acylphosphatase [Gemmatimonadota bacterium]
MPLVDKSFVIRGRVQGVGFRWWTRQTASALGVVGAVENLPDGTVRVVARAESETLSRFADKLRRGPPLARVESVEEASVELPSGLGSFTIDHS